MLTEKQFLKERVAALTAEKERLKKIQDEHEELESFLSWLNQCCEERHFHIAGVQKVNQPIKWSKYIGFLLGVKKKPWPYKSCEYVLHGYLSRGKKSVMLPEYKAILYQDFSHVPDVTNTLWVSDNYVCDKENFRKGIGSVGISAIKRLAFHLHCTKIEGKMSSLNLEEEELRAFYRSAGFVTAIRDGFISFDMEAYSKSKMDDF